MGPIDLIRRLSRKSSSSNPSGQRSRQGSKASRSESLTPQSSNPFRKSSAPTRRPSVLPNMNDSIPPSDPPPEYTEVSKSYMTTNQPNMAASASSAPGEDPYAFLKTFDTIFLIDDSGSMAGRSWREVEEALKLITPICASHDADGIDIYFLNRPDSRQYMNVSRASTVVEIFQTVRPYGGTPTGQKLNSILKPYLQRYEASPNTTKPVNIIVITDGAPTDDVESPIIAAAKKLDRLEAPAWQVGIQFFQVGKDPGAREHLKQLDDGLRDISGDADLRDMVDTVEYKGDDGAQLTSAGIMKTVLGSVNRRLDRNSKELHRH